MSDPIKSTISLLQNELREQEVAVLATKKLINSLSARAGLPPPYSDSELSGAAGVPLTIQSDQFYGQPLASCMRTVLEMRKAQNLGPASVDEIHDALVQGGYKFETSNEDNRKKNLKVSLGKNIAVFHKLPNGLFGLTEWYPKVKGGGRRRDESESTAAPTEAEEDAGEGGA